MSCQPTGARWASNPSGTDSSWRRSDWIARSRYTVFQNAIAAVWLPKISSDLAQVHEWVTLTGMIDFLTLLGGSLVGLCRSHVAWEAQMAFLRQQLLVLN
jgi:hypothetical protein